VEEHAPEDGGRELNEAQRRAVLHEDGPLLVVAGAGSGKTRVLTHRIAHLVNDLGVSPFGVLAITFTNKAADEMRTRLVRLVGPVARRMWVSTFHSACVRILRRHADRLGFRSAFSIYDDADSLRLISYIVDDFGLDPRKASPRAVQSAISAAKSDLVDFESYRELVGSPLEEIVADVYPEYQRRLLAANAMDFDDLLLVTVNLLDSQPDVLEEYQRRFAHVLVDEYQDTNRPQNELVLMLGREHRNVCVVGDTDQSVYEWRGASRRNLSDFERTFPDVTVVLLEQNYRSTKPILDAANSVIAHNPGRTPKVLWTDRIGGEPVTHYQASDERTEAAWVAEEICRLRHDDLPGWGDVAVFYRANAQSRVLEEELARRAVPYKVVGGVRFYERREVKDVLAYLRALDNPADEVSLKRIVNVPKRGVGDTSVKRLESFAASHHCGFAEALARAEEAGVTGRALTGVRSFLALMEDLSQSLQPARGEQRAPEEEGEGSTAEAGHELGAGSDGDDGDAGGGTAAARALRLVLERTGYRAELEAEAEHHLEAASRLENLAELVAVAEEHQELEEFLESVTLVSDADELEDDGSRVALMTLHTAKGLEFPAVFIVGLEEGVFPHTRSLLEPDRLEEERRLCYVGMTRAERFLSLSNATWRTLWGASQQRPPSRFLREIPGHLLRRADGSASVSPVRTTGAERLALSVGEDVVHAKWGEGVVVALQGEGDKAEATVRFPGLGEKQLLLSWTPLKRA
jgi:DNA helicase II / ATP-dependent DNA helicase PcrA